MALARPAAAINMLGVLVSPHARRTLLPVMMQTTSTLPGNQTYMYCRINTISSSLAPISANSGSIKSQRVKATMTASDREM